MSAKKGHIIPDLIVKSKNKNTTNILGYASVFDVIDTYNDIIVKGAFKAALNKDVRLLWQHDHLKPIGVITLLEEDYYGLKIEAEINNETTFGQEASALVKQGAICGLSIDCSVQSFDYNAEGMRIINDVNLSEISIVTFPANRYAKIKDVKNAEILAELKALSTDSALSEELLKDALNRKALLCEKSLLRLSNLIRKLESD